MGEITRGETCEGMRLFLLLVWAAGELGTTLGALELQHSKRKGGGWETEEQCPDGLNFSLLLG